MEHPYTYIFIRIDLPVPQQIVQAAHAAQEAGRLFSAVGTDHIVLIAIKNEDQLLVEATRLSQRGIKCCTFFEPDINAYTAFATEPLVGDTRQKLRRYQLYK